jgi:hypothetical protein
MIDPIQFNPENYELLLTTARDNNYRFIRFDEIKRPLNGKNCILRHDIDADLYAAHTIAKIDAWNGISSTFFLMLRSPLYNLFSRYNSWYVEEILGMGHAIGLHYDAAFTPKHKVNMHNSIYHEITILEEMFDTHVDAVSFHQPGSDILRGNIRIPHKINTYNNNDMREFCYISDSNMIFKYADPFEVFSTGRYNNVHLLLHPLWWAYGNVLSPEVVWDTVITNNFELSQRQLLQTEVVYGNPRTMSLHRGDIT